jgi:hypothetical protein
MKIRIKGNSIRVRLSRPEVETLAQTGHLEEKTEFGNSAFAYVLRAKEGISTLHAAYASDTISMFVPSQLVNGWPTNEVVGFEANQDIGEGKSLFLLLEKDFKCIDNTNEDQSDNYEHPTKVC